MKRLLTD